MIKVLVGKNNKSSEETEKNSKLFSNYASVLNPTMHWGGSKKTRQTW
jgi:hypothetical protein